MVRIYTVRAIPAAAAMLVIGAPAVRAAQQTPEQGASALRLMPPAGHTDEVTSVAISRDSKLILTGSWDHTARLWDASTGREIRTFRGGVESVTSVAISPDGRSGLTGSLDNLARIWDLESGALLHVLKGHTSDVRAVAYNSDGSLAATASGDGTARLWDTTTGTLVRELKGHTDIVSSVRFSRDGQMLLTASRDKTVRLWKVSTGEPIRQLTGHTDWVRSAEFTEDGAYVVSAAYDRTERIWSVADGSEVGKTAYNWPGLEFTAISPVGKTGIVYAENSPYIWDMAGGKLARRLEGHTGLVKTAAFSVDGRMVVTGSKDHTARLWDVASGSLIRELRGHSAGEAVCVAISPDGRRLAASFGRRATRVWEAKSGRPLGDLAVASPSGSQVAFSQDSKYAITGSADGSVRFWNAGNGALERTLAGGVKYIGFVAASRDGVRVAAGGADGKVFVWDGIAAPAAPKSLDGGNNTVTRSLAMSPDGRYLLRGSSDVLLWDVNTGAQVLRMTPRYVSAFYVAISPDGRYALSPFPNQTDEGPEGNNRILVWEVPSGKQVQILKGHTDLVRSAAFSADSKRVVSGSDDGTARVWDIGTGMQTASYTGHATSVDTAVFSPDGRWVISGSWDNTVRVWSSTTGQELYTYLSLEGGDWLAYAPDGRFDGTAEAIAQVNFAQGLRTYAVEQFFEQFYTPGLVTQLHESVALAAPRSGTPAKALVAGEPPIVRIASPAAGASSASEVEVTVNVTQQNGGGVRAVRLYQNGRLVGGESNLRNLQVAANDPGAGAARRFRITLLPGANVLRAVGYSNTDIESRPDEVTLTWRAPEPVRPTLYVLAVGINRYKEASINLAYARPDAESVAAFFQKRGDSAGAFGAAKVTALLDDIATRDGIRAALSRIATEAKPGDVVFLYLAGHGLVAPDNTGTGQTFYFIPQDADLKLLPDHAADTAVSGTEIDAMLRQIRFCKVALVYDACHSGAAVTADSLKEGAAQEQALGLVARSQGIYILAASTAGQTAGELASLGHGVVTYVLLQGLEGGAATEGRVWIAELLGYVGRKTPELIEKQHGTEQEPVPLSFGKNFPLVTIKSP